VSEHVGTGPNGQNLLGFLSAVGVLALIERCWPEQRPRMRWELRERWRPVWLLDGDMSDDELVSVLARQLVARRNAPESTLLGDRLPAPPDEFAKFAQLAAKSATPTDHNMADFVAAFGCEIVTDHGNMQDTAWRTMNAGQQQFLRSIREVHEVRVEQVGEAIFGPWRYADKRPALRYDPVDDRRGALRATDPSDTIIWTVRGANALASEALRFFPCAPGQRLATTGFYNNGPDVFVTWPIWSAAVTPEVLRSLLNLAELLADHPDRIKLRAMGVAEVYRTHRVRNGRYRNFTPARPV
jgi:hypothetical protein